MKPRYIILVLLLICSAITMRTAMIERNTSKVEKSLRPNPATMTYPQMVSYVAPQFNQDPHKIKQIIYNESGFKVQCHDSCRAKNITAIHDSTFKTWLPEYEKENNETLSMNSQFDQVKMMSWAFSKGYDTAWTTAVACKSKNGVYKFYSHQMKKNYEVHCQPLPKKYDII